MDTMSVQTATKIVTQEAEVQNKAVKAIVAVVEIGIMAIKAVNEVAVLTDIQNTPQITKEALLHTDAKLTMFLFVNYPML